MRVRFVLQELGPAAIKFGQWMSTRPDILPLEYIAEFEKLQDRIPPFPFEDVKRIIREELGEEIEDLFEEFSPEVIASGSIAQVHRARLKDGTSVAVKVQRPGIAKIIDTDMEILVDLSRLAGDYIIKTDIYDPVAIVEEFSFAIGKQLDFWNEGRNIERFKKNFEKVDYVFIPGVLLDLSTRNLLTIEYLDGIKISNVKEIEEEGLDKKAIARNISYSYFKQIYIDGFFHGDPHPGNLFALPNNVIGFTDFGIMGYLDDKAKKHLMKTLLAVNRKDSKDLAEAMFDMGILKGKSDFDAFTMELDYLLSKYYDIPLKLVSFGGVLSDVMNLMNRYNLRMPPNLALLTVTLWSVEGLLRDIDPEFNSFEAAKPFVRELISKQMSPVSRVREFGRNVVEYYDFLEDLPRRMNHMMSKLEKGELKIIFSDEKLENLNVVIERSSNRLILGALVSASVVSVSALILSGNRPVIGGIQILDILLGVAAVVGGWLIYSIFRSGRF